MKNERSAESHDTLHPSYYPKMQDSLTNNRSLAKQHERLRNRIGIPLPPLLEVRDDTSTYTATQNARITALSEETGRTRDEVITAALTLYELGLKAQQHNKKFGIVEPDQQLITEVGSL